MQMGRIADFKILSEWKKLGYTLKPGVSRPFAWRSKDKKPMYELNQVVRITTTKKA